MTHVCLKCDWMIKQVIEHQVPKYFTPNGGIPQEIGSYTESRGVFWCGHPARQCEITPQELLDIPNCPLDE